MSLRLIAAALLTMPVAGAAQTAAPPAAKPAARPAPVQLTPQPRRAALSPEGRAIASKIYATPDPRYAQLSNDIANLRTQRAMLIATQPIDLDKLEEMLRREETVQAEMRTRVNDRLMTLLRALPPADLAPMLQSINQPRTAAPAAPAPVQQPAH
jgi:hypothetical protein